MILVMIPLAITELGTDSWITELLTPAMTDLGLNAGWVLVYAMAIVLVLRLFAGPLVHRFLAARPARHLGIGRGGGVVVVVRCHQRGGDRGGGHGVQLRQGVLLAHVARRRVRAVAEGGAITMNVVAGIGMLGAGVIGGPLIGQVLDRQMVHGVAAYDAQHNTQLVETLKTERTGILGDYTAIDPSKRAALAGDEKAAVDAADRESKHDALRTIAILPVIMFLVYLGLILYFRSRGGYKPVVLDLK
jgi:hypothetical protein